MKIYKVGGCVRDKLLGRVSRDIDYVVVGSSVDTFLKEHPGAECIGKSFPVYLYKGDEYAFARTERSTGVKHNDFRIFCGPDVSLHEDLMRRDLTINAIAEDDKGNLHYADDRPRNDLEDKILRHVDAKAFVGDPLRVFRVARFACELHEFTVHESTIELMKTMAKPLESLSAERVFKELKKALETDYSSRFFETLRDCDCLDYWFPEIKSTTNVPAGHPRKHGSETVWDHIMSSMNDVSRDTPHLKFASLCHDLGKALTDPEAWPKHHRHDALGYEPIYALCRRLKVPSQYQTASVMFCKEHMRMHKIWEMKSGKVVRLLFSLGKRFPGGLEGFLKCAESDGFDPKDSEDLITILQGLKGIKLPEEYYGRGPACGQILLNMQCHAYTYAKRDLREGI